MQQPRDDSDYTSKDVNDRTDMILTLLPQLLSSNAIATIEAQKKSTLLQSVITYMQTSEETNKLIKKYKSSSNPLNKLEDAENDALMKIVLCSEKIIEEILRRTFGHDSKGVVYRLPLKKEEAREYCEVLDALKETLTTGKTNQFDKLGHTKFDYYIAYIKDLAVKAASVLTFAGSLLLGATTLPGIALFGASIALDLKGEKIAKKPSTLFYAGAVLNDTAKKDKATLEKVSKHVTDNTAPHKINK